MPRLPGISQKEAVRVFQKLGYRIVRESINAITMGTIARDAGLLGGRDVGFGQKALKLGLDHGC
jgi:hypothetical protein